MVPAAGVGGMIPERELCRSVARMIEAKIAGNPRFVSRTGARAFLRLHRSTSRIGQQLATVGPVSGGLRFSTPDRLVVIERSDVGYRVLVRSIVGGFPVVWLDEVHADVDSIVPALLDALPVARH